MRPDDSRYGENPNRLQTHTQLQVILKPDPGNPQELYLGSLAALGIDVAAHDVRFVEDNWASPALGAWGLGWEVWLDGLEITQFTYFQQAGGLNLDPVSVEITYGIERIIMALQDKTHFKEIEYAPGIRYGEVFGQAEYEMSRYYLDDADVAANRQLLELYAAEAQRLIDAGLPVPAHTYVLKCSQAFNVLDARGAVSTADRAAEFGRMRRLAGDVAKLWVARRDELGHPLGLVGRRRPAPPRSPPPAERTRPAHPGLRDRHRGAAAGRVPAPPATTLQRELTEGLAGDPARARRGAGVRHPPAADRGGRSEFCSRPTRWPALEPPPTRRIESQSSSPRTASRSSACSPRPVDGGPGPNTLPNVMAEATAAYADHDKIPTYVLGVGADLTDLNMIAQAGNTEAIIVNPGQAASRIRFWTRSTIRFASLPCQFTIDPSAGKPDPSLVNVVFHASSAAPAQNLSYVSSADECARATDNLAWYFDNPTAPTQVFVCPTTCTLVNTYPRARSTCRSAAHAGTKFFADRALRRCSASEGGGVVGAYVGSLKRDPLRLQRHGETDLVGRLL